MDFVKYNSIENSYRQKFVNNIIIDPDLMNQDWYVTEKVHGANFAIFVEAAFGEELDIKFGKRSGFITGDDKFYGLNNNKEKFVEYAKRMANLFPDTDIVIRGELYGGGYNHPDVPSTVDPRIQRGVEYTNANEFMAFDLELDNKIVTQYDANLYFNLTNIPTVPLLFTGSFDDAMKHTNEFNSHVHRFHGHPELEVNVCEGVVIKPNVASYFPNGNRVILKNKNEKFSEKKARKPRVVADLTDDQNDVISNLGQFVTDNRLTNVLSHIGDIQQKDFGKICGLFTKDVIADYLKEYEPLEEKKDWKVCTKHLTNTCTILLRARWLDILDENG